MVYCVTHDDFDTNHTDKAVVRERLNARQVERETREQRGLSQDEDPIASDSKGQDRRVVDMDKEIGAKERMARLMNKFN